MAAAQPTSSERAFERFTREYLDHYFAAEPVAATEAGDHRFDARLPDYSRKAIDAEIASLAAFRTRLAKIVPEKLPREVRQDRAILMNEIEKRLFSLETLRVWERNPLVYTRVIGDGIRTLLARDFAPGPDRVRSAIERMKAIPAVLDAGKANLINPPRVHAETALRQNEGAIEFFEKDVPAAIDSLAPELAADGKRVAKEAADALRAYQWFLEEELVLRSNGAYSIGYAAFRRRIELAFCEPVDPDSIYMRAEEEFELVREEIYRLAVPIHDEVFPAHVHGTHTAVVRNAIVREALGAAAVDRLQPEELLSICRTEVDSLLAFVRSKDLVELGDLPPLSIEWTPAFSRGVAVAGLDAPGPLDEGQRSFFFVAPVPASWTPLQVDSYLREYNREMLRILSIHEAVPGHYVQLVRSNRHGSLVRSIFTNGPMVEGWAVYGEHWMLDAGYGGGDPRLRLQQLKLYLRTVANAILDYRVHVMNISEQEAMDLLVDGAYQEESEARGKWTRARLGAGQLSTYFGGYLAIRDLETAYRESKGDAFRQKDFNEALLASGSPPVWALRENLLGTGTP